MTDRITYSNDISKRMLSKYDESASNINEIETVVEALMCELGIGGFMGIEASKPSGYPDGESMRWNVVLFRSIFCHCFCRNRFRLSSDYKSFRCMESNTRQCQSNNISGTSEICAVRKSKSCY